MKGLYNDSFDYFGADVYIEFDIDSENEFTATLIEVGGVELLEHLKHSYVNELLQEASDRINKI